MSLRHAILSESSSTSRPTATRSDASCREGISTFWPVNLAAIYPALRKLEEEGLVSHRLERSDEGRPDRKVYEITEAGREEMANWANAPGPRV